MDVHGALPEPTAELVAALDQAFDNDVPLDVVEAAVALRKHVDELIRTHVFIAREIGETWESIGDSLGVSRASAWQKYSRPSDLPEEFEEQKWRADLKVLKAEMDSAKLRVRAEVLRSGGSDDEVQRREAEIAQDFMQKAWDRSQEYLSELQAARVEAKRLRDLDTDD